MAGAWRPPTNATCGGECKAPESPVCRPSRAGSFQLVPPQYALLGSLGPFREAAARTGSPDRLRGVWRRISQALLERVDGHMALGEVAGLAGHRNVLPRRQAALGDGRAMVRRC